MRDAEEGTILSVEDWICLCAGKSLAVGRKQEDAASGWLRAEGAGKGG